MNPETFEFKTVIFVSNMAANDNCRQAVLFLKFEPVAGWQQLLGNLQSSDEQDKRLHGMRQLTAYEQLEHSRSTDKPRLYDMLKSSARISMLVKADRSVWNMIGTT